MANEFSTPFDDKNIQLQDWKICKFLVRPTTKRKRSIFLDEKQGFYFKVWSKLRQRKWA